MYCNPNEIFFRVRTQGIYKILHPFFWKSYMNSVWKLQHSILKLIVVLNVFSNSKYLFEIIFFIYEILSFWNRKQYGVKTNI